MEWNQKWQGILEINSSLSSGGQVWDSGGEVGEALKLVNLEGFTIGPIKQILVYHSHLEDLLKHKYQAPLQWFWDDRHGVGPEEFLLPPSC